MGNLSLQQITILDSWVLTLFYGVYVVIFAASIHSLLFRERRSAIKKHLLLIIIVLFAICTAENIIYFLIAFFTTHTVTYDRLDCAALALVVTNSVIADGYLIWRCFAVWGRKRSVVLIPILMLVTGAVCGYIDTVIYFKLYRLRLRYPHQLVPTSLPGYNQLLNLEHYISTAFYVTSFITNIMTSLLIAGRIWWSTRYNKHSHGYKFRCVASLVVESGCIYGVCLLLLAILSPLPFEGTNTAAIIISSITTQIVGIFPTLIIVLVALGRTSDLTMSGTSYTFNDPGTSLHPIEFAPRNLAINVVRETQSDLPVTEISREDTEHGFAQKYETLS